MELKASFLAVLLACSSISSPCFGQAGARNQVVELPPYFFDWTKRDDGIGYGVAGNVYLDTPGAKPLTNFAVGAQINAHVLSGEQWAFGLSTEAWAHPGSKSILIGLESGVINMEPENKMPKYVLSLVYKTRPDVDYNAVPANPGNENSVFIDVASQPWTGPEAGIRFEAQSLYPSAMEPNPLVIDFRKVPMEQFRNWILVRYPDGYCEFYTGKGQKEIRQC